MGAFWNPNGGFIVGNRRLSKKEVAVLKRKWSENPRSAFTTRRSQEDHRKDKKP